jgi:hypothetical protein
VEWFSFGIGVVIGLILGGVFIGWWLLDRMMNVINPDEVDTVGDHFRSDNFRLDYFRRKEDIPRRIP